MDEAPIRAGSECAMICRQWCETVRRMDGRADGLANATLGCLSPVKGWLQHTKRKKTSCLLRPR